MAYISTPVNQTIDTRDVAQQRLKLVLLTNATTSFAGGLLAATATSWLADRLGLDGGSASTWTRAVGIGLIIFGIAVAAVAIELRGDALRRAALTVSAMDVAWVLATIVVIGTAGLSAFGVVVATVVGLAVLCFGILQIVYAHGSGNDHAT